MGKSCNYCMLWADEINGILHHLESVAPVVLASSDEPDVMAEFADQRKWRFKLVSTAQSKFKQALGFETSDGAPQPGVSILKKKTKMVRFINTHQLHSAQEIHSVVCGHS